MKSKLILSLCAAAVFALTGCNGDDKKTADTAAAPSAPAAGQVIKVGVCPGPYGEMVEKIISPLVAEEGYKIELVTFTDYVQPNLALASGDIQANLFQHRSYFDNFVETQKVKLEAVINVPTLGMAFFSDKVTSYDQLEEGSKVGLPNDPINLGRALGIAQKAGLIKLNHQENDNKASIADITENKYKLEFVPMDAAQITRSLDSVVLGMIPGNYAYAANFDFSKALSVEDVSEPVKNLIAVKAGDKFHADLFYRVVHSQKFKDAITAHKNFDAFTRPDWWDKVKADADTEAASADAAPADAPQADAAPADASQADAPASGEAPAADQGASQEAPADDKAA